MKKFGIKRDKANKKQGKEEAKKKFWSFNKT